MRINIDELSEFSRLSDESRESYLGLMHKYPNWTHQQLMARIKIAKELIFSESEEEIGSLCKQIMRNIKTY